MKRNFLFKFGLLILAVLFSDVTNSVYAQPISYESEITGAFPAKNTSLPVGSLGGGVAVNLSGAATYEIPIAVAPGTAGMVPKLSIAYNSQGGNGMLGKGWTLTGLSAISRNGRDYYHEGQATSIEWNNNDAFSIDGSRMHVINGTHGTNQCEYAPEQENYTRITQQGTLNNSPAWFKAVLKDGTIINYGDLRYSGVRDNNGMETLTWKISSMRDLFGNEVQYEYENVNYEHRLSRIYYTVNTSQGITATNVIRFTYKERTDKETYYVGGSTYKSNSLLEQVEVYNYEEGTVRKYVMSYFYDGDWSMLQKVKEIGSDNSEINATLFQYNSNILPYTLSNSQVTDLPPVDGTVDPINGPEEKFEYLLTLDFDKDGYTDLVSIEKTVTQSNSCNTGFMCAAQEIQYKLVFSQNNKLNGFTKKLEMPFLSFCTCDQYTSKHTDALARENFQVGDFDGDGNEDLAYFKRERIYSTVDFYPITELKFLTQLKRIASGFNPITNSIPIPSRLSGTTPTKAFAYTADYDGDGVSEILTNFSTSYNQYNRCTDTPVLQITSLKSNLAFDPVYPEPNSYNDLECIRDEIRNSKFCSPVNINGGAAQELMFAWTDLAAGKVISIKKDPNSGSFYSKLEFSNTCPTASGYFSLGDFNGDGLTDILEKENYQQNQWWISYSNGTNFNARVPFTFNIEPYYVHPPDYTLSPEETPIVTADFNNDGKTDIAHFYTTIKQIAGDYFKYANIEVYFSMGNNTFKRQNYEIEVDPKAVNEDMSLYLSRPQHLYNNYSMYMGDFNGDGRPDMMNYLGVAPTNVNASNHRNPNYLSIGSGQPSRLLTKIRNGYGMFETVEYDKMNSYIYTDDYPSNYPLVSVNGPLYAVSHQQVFMSTGSAAQNSYYNYKNLFVLKDGRGIQGFSEIRKTTPFNNNLHSAITVQSVTGHQSPFYIPTIQETRSYLDGAYSYNLISIERTVSQAIAIGSAGRYVGRPILTQETNHLSNTTKSTSYQSYDLYNNPTSVTETIPGLESSQRTITYAPANSTGSLVPYLPEQVTTSLSKNNSQTVSTTDFTTYTLGKVQTQKQFYNSLAEITTTLTYNPTGTTATKTMSAPGETPRGTMYGYDAKHRFVTSETNALNQTVTSTYDPKFGTVRTATGFDGLVTNYQYDGFGKLLNTIMPDTRIVTERWSWLNGQGLTESLMRKQVEDPASTPAYTDFNALGKETEHGTKIWSSSGTADWSREVLKYNIAGQLIHKTMPRRSTSETVFELDYTYDPYGRLTQTCTQHGCTNITYTYTGSNLKTETTDPAGRVKYGIKDGADKLIESKDESGILTYVYDGWGHVTQTKAGLTALSTAVYDAYGRKQSITEPTSGTTAYTYTGYGELKTQTDAAGQITQFLYDNGGRAWKTSFPEGTLTTEWYNNAGTGTGRQVKSVTRRNAQGTVEHSKTHNYDNLGRLTKTQYHNGRSTLWTYDAISRPATQRYVSGAMARYKYKDGHLIEISDGSNTLRYRLEDINGSGNATQEWRGNGKTTLQTYDYGNLTNTFTAGVQDYSLVHDFQRGLITRRTDNLTQNFDDFTYDPASRLIKTTTGYNGLTPAVLPPDQIQTYGGNALTSGNILTKTDIGSYNYGKYHQVSYTDNAAGSIPTMRQDVTYTSYHRPLTLSEGIHKAEFVYDGGADRFAMRKFLNGALDYTKEYYDDGTVLYLDAGGTATEMITPVAGDHGIAWIQVARLSRGGPEVPPGGKGDGPATSSQTGGGLVGEDTTGGETNAFEDEDYNYYTTDLYYPYADHLGSIVVLTDGQGNVVHRQAFDAWGRRREPNSWATDDSQVPPRPFRWLWGYTGHEQLDDFGLVNMNARLYDPKLGRLLSVDNYVSDPANPQAYNRYTYALNNPISYVDPSGNNPFIAAMLIGAAISTFSYTAQAATAPGGLARNFNLGDLAESAFTGAAMGGFTFGVGQAFGAVGLTAKGAELSAGMGFAKEVGRATAHGLIGGLLNDASGGNFWAGFASGALSSFMSSAVQLSHVNLGKVGGAFFSMGVGAGASYAGDGNPWMGAASGLMSYTLNHIADHDGGGDGDGKKRNTGSVSGSWDGPIVGTAPDDDRYLTVQEVNLYRSRGGGRTLNVDIKKLDLSGIYASDFPRGVGSSETFNLLLRSNSLNDGLVFGNITLTLHKNNMVTAYRDEYNFEMHPWNNIKNWARNFETIIGKWNAGSSGISFYININGTAYIKAFNSHMNVK